jgi:[ribosomal protein S18]-alanine N-acetyltransferase
VTDGGVPRPVRRHDLAALAELERAAFDDPWPASLLEGEIEVDGAFQLLADGPGGTPDGYAAFRHIFDEAELLRLAVHPRARRRGLGRRLLVAGLGELSRRHITRCFLEVRRHNTGARALYESIGFLAVGERLAYYADGSDAVVYRLDLDSPRR